MPLFVGDEIISNPGSTGAFEFDVGGRVGTNWGSRLFITGERSVRGTRNEALLKKGGVWAKCEKLKEPLEIQTNGGVMGIKG